MFILGFIIFIGVLCSPIFLSSSGRYFFDFSILITIIGINISMVIATTSFGDLMYALKVIIKGSGKQDKDQLDKGISILNLLFKVTIVSGVLISIVEFIIMMRTLDSPSSIGPYISVVLLSVLYSLIISFFFILPGKYILDKHLK